MAKSAVFCVFKVIRYLKTCAFDGQTRPKVGQRWPKSAKVEIAGFGADWREKRFAVLSGSLVLRGLDLAFTVVVHSSKNLPARLKRWLNVFSWIRGSSPRMTEPSWQIEQP